MRRAVSADCPHHAPLSPRKSPGKIRPAAPRATVPVPRVCLLRLASVLPVSSKRLRRRRPASQPVEQKSPRKVFPAAEPHTAAPCSTTAPIILLSLRPGGRPTPRFVLPLHEVLAKAPPVGAQKIHDWGLRAARYEIATFLARSNRPASTPYTIGRHFRSMRKAIATPGRHRGADYHESIVAVAAKLELRRSGY